MFIVAESGSAIFNIDTSTIISIYKFKAGDEEKWAVCCDYSADDETYHLLTNKTENRDVAVVAMGRIIEAIKNDVKLLDLSRFAPRCTNCEKFGIGGSNRDTDGYYVYCCNNEFEQTFSVKEVLHLTPCEAWKYGDERSDYLEYLSR